MNMEQTRSFSVLLAFICIYSHMVAAADEPAPVVKVLRAGMIGLDTSHVNAFTNIMNSPKATGDLARLKVVAGSLADAVAIYELAQRHHVPVWSASSIRFSSTIRSLLDNDQVGEIVGCTTWGPCSYQEGIPDMFFYGIHGIEGLFTVMGTGCVSVTRTTVDGTDILAGVWQDNRIGTYRGIRRGKAEFGATAFGTQGLMTIGRASAYQELC